jgi:hypothetical protein
VPVRGLHSEETVPSSPWVEVPDFQSGEAGLSETASQL